MEVPGQPHALAAYHCGKSHWHPLNRKWVETQSQSGCFGEEIKSLAPVEIQTPDPAACILVIILTMLSWLLHNRWEKTIT
jgi:hypothetical protein